VELCKQLTDASNDALRDGDPKEKARLYDLIVAAQFSRALQEDHWPSFRELIDRFEGAVAPQFKDVTPLKSVGEEGMKMVEDSNEHDSQD